MEEYDTDKSGSIDIDEFTKAMQAFIDESYEPCCSDGKAHDVNATHAH